MGSLIVNGKVPSDIRYGGQIVMSVFYGSELVWSRTPEYPVLGLTYGPGVMKWIPQVSRYIYFIHTQQSPIGACLTGHQSADGIVWKRFTNLGAALTYQPPSYRVTDFYYWYDTYNSKHTFRVKRDTSTNPYHDVVYTPGVSYTPLATS